MALHKLPAIQFYPGDWKKDIGVQSLSFHDRGVWLEILLLMHDSEDRGKLVLNGQPMPDEAIARAIGLDNQTFNQTLTNLLTYGVASRDDDSRALINRRMVKDEHLRRIRQEAGKMGGNPVLVKHKSNQNGDGGDKQNSTPSSSSSSSSPEQISEAKASSPRKSSGTPDSVEEIYKAYPRKIGKQAAVKAILRAIQHLKARGMPIREAEVYLFRRVQSYARSPAGQDGEFTPHPATWFNRGSYDDDPQEWQQKSTERGTNGNHGRNGFSGEEMSRLLDSFGGSEADDTLPSLP